MSPLKKNLGQKNNKNNDAKSLALFCGKGTNAVFIGDDFSSEPSIPSSARIAEVKVDARGMDSPVIEIEFSSTVNFLTSDDEGLASLSFLLFRVQNNDEQVLVNIWPYEAFDIEDITNNFRLSTSFVFNYCECLEAPGCFKYFVEVFAGSLYSASIGINNVEIAALAGESS